MGFLWSKSEESEIQYSNILETSLLQTEPELIFRSGDILITPASALEITMGMCLWSNIALVVYSEKNVYAFSNGVCTDIDDYLFNHPHTVCRPLQCIRYSGFDREVEEAAAKTADLMMKKYNMSIEKRESYCAATMLGYLGLVDLTELNEFYSQLKTDDFAPNGRLKLKNYTRECWKVN